MKHKSSISAETLKQQISIFLERAFQMTDEQLDGMAQEGGALHLIGIEEAGAAVRIGVSRPDDVPFRRHVPEQPIEEGTHRGRLDINQIFHWFAFPSVVFSFP